MSSEVNTYDHVGKQPILVRGEFYEKGSVIEGTDEEMAFFVVIGAVKKREPGALKSDAPEPPVSPSKKKV